MCFQIVTSCSPLVCQSRTIYRWHIIKCCSASLSVSFIGQPFNPQSCNMYLINSDYVQFVQGAGLTDVTCLMCLGSGHQSWWRWPVTITPITGDVITGAHLHDDYDVTNNNSGDRQKLLFVVQSAIPPPTCPPNLVTAQKIRNVWTKGLSVSCQSAFSCAHQVRTFAVLLLLALDIHERGANK